VPCQLSSAVGRSLRRSCYGNRLDLEKRDDGAKRTEIQGLHGVPLPRSHLLPQYGSTLGSLHLGKFDGGESVGALIYSNFAWLMEVSATARCLRTIPGELEKSWPMGRMVSLRNL
jgi:hypothetical protein